MQEPNRKRKMMLTQLKVLTSMPEWQAFQAYLNETIDQGLTDFESANDERRALIILGRIKEARNILQLNADFINILMDSTPDNGPVGEL